MLGQHALQEAIQDAQLGIRHSTVQLKAMNCKWMAVESFGKILVATLLIFKLDIMDRSSGYKEVRQVFGPPFCSK